MRCAILFFSLLLGLVMTRPALADAFIRLSMGAEGTMRHDVSASVGPDTPFAIASVGKTLTAVAVLRLVERGNLSLDDPAAQRLPDDLAGSIALDGIRLRHLLTMTSGLPDYYTDDWLDAALADPADVQSVAGALRAIASEPALFEPGRGFAYSNTSYVLLGAVLEEATGMPYAEVLRDEIFGPAGMTDSFVFGSQALPATFASGHAYEALVRRYYTGRGLGDGGVIASARDVARFYRALFVERRLLSDRLLALLLHAPDDEEYGMGIEVAKPVAGHSGGDLGFSSDVRINLQSGLIAVELVAAEDAGTDWAWDRVTRYD